MDALLDAAVWAVGASTRSAADREVPACSPFGWHCAQACTCRWHERCYPKFMPENEGGLEVLAELFAPTHDPASGPNGIVNVGRCGWSIGAMICLAVAAFLFATLAMAVCQAALLVLTPAKSRRATADRAANGKKQAIR